jgi:uncharacterized membrane protein YcaP (DUF421 family)
MDLHELYRVTVSPLELVVRGTAMYWFLFLLFRFVLRRSVGQVGVSDILLLVIVADAAQNGMSGDYRTVAEGFVLVATLVGWSLALDALAYRFRWVARWVEPPTLTLIRHGQLQHRNLRRQLITEEELRSHLRQQGVASPAQVRLANLEGDGRISVIREDGAPIQPSGRPGSTG